jgi:putative transposase
MSDVAVTTIVELELCAVCGELSMRKAMARLRKKHVQQSFTFRQHGGKRRGAGRPPKGRRSSEPHKTRDEIDHRHPILATTRMVDGLGPLRRKDTYLALRLATIAVSRRTNFRIVYLSLQSNHLHLLLEADNKEALSKGLQAFLISAAKRINRALSLRNGTPREGKVFADRYHARALTSPRAVRNALCYVLNNWRKHREDRAPFAASWKVDPYSNGIDFPGWKELDGSVVFQPPSSYQWSRPDRRRRGCCASAGSYTSRSRSSRRRGPRRPKLVVDAARNPKWSRATSSVSRRPASAVEVIPIECSAPRLNTGVASLNERRDAGPHEQRPKGHWADVGGDTIRPSTHRRPRAPTEELERGARVEPTTAFAHITGALRRRSDGFTSFRSRPRASALLPYRFSSTAGDHEFADVVAAASRRRSPGRRRRHTWAGPDRGRQPLHTFVDDVGVRATEDRSQARATSDLSPDIGEIMARTARSLRSSPVCRKSPRFHIGEFMVATRARVDMPIVGAFDSTMDMPIVAASPGHSSNVDARRILLPPWRTSRDDSHAARR